MNYTTPKTDFAILNEHDLLTERANKMLQKTIKGRPYTASVQFLHEPRIRGYVLLLFLKKHAYILDKMYMFKSHKELDNLMNRDFKDGVS